ncbi:hypothetical protein RA272_28745, partial [Pseudomonas syringae pv. tagetis]
SWPETTPLPDLPGVTHLDRAGTRVTAHTRESDRLARVLLTETPATELEISRGGLEDAFAALVNRSGEH